MSPTGMALRELSFFGLASSKHVDKAKTSTQALKQAGLDWTVKLDPVYRKKNKGGGFEPITGRFAIVREDTDAVLGNVGKSYVPLQNREAFAFVDTLLEEGAARYEVALELKGGKEVLLVAKLGEGWKILGDDVHDLYVVFRNGHNGGRAVQKLITPVRLACVNMMPLATREARYRFAVVHSSTMHQRLQEAHSTMQQVAAYAEAYAKLAETLAARRITVKRFRGVLDEVLPDRPKSEEAKDAMLDVLRDSPAIEGHRGDSWGALNAATEYMEHLRRDRGREGRLIDTLDGSGRRVRQELVEALVVTA